MQVRFWGTRGSIPAPGRSTLRYGGNTSCVEVRTDSGELLIFDGGTGARELGLALAKAGPVRAHVFIGHTHADHIQGLPFFVPAFLPGSHLTIYGPAGIDRSFPHAMSGQMDYAYFPVPFQELPARLDFEELGEGAFSIGSTRVQAQYLNHTAPCLGYRVEAGGAALVYATDHEPHAFPCWRPDRPDGSYAPDALLHPGDAGHAELLRDADLVIHDSQYTAAEYPAKHGWGHSPIEYVVDLALVGGVRRLALFHHDPTRDDEAVDGLLAAARAQVAAAGRQLEIVAAAEGEELDGRRGRAGPGRRARSTSSPSADPVAHPGRRGRRPGGAAAGGGARGRRLRRRAGGQRRRGGPAGRAAELRPVPARHRDAGAGRPGRLPDAAGRPTATRRADRDPDRAHPRRGHRRGVRPRRHRLHDQAVRHVAVPGPRALLADAGRHQRLRLICWSSVARWIRLEVM